ncbi:GNAT family N-acetyltransferase [Streptomyces sp. FH025]|uniref:GNAT family N-acetyltransferase n=1 Tax=Streptomyces sp. FH025 TaxID=2815937 RepID=UPI001A9CE0E6|nr:GNAT family N-acetyltransferase [Streptomyces sp. FH025]MBO1417888.1 GNAT family N-acetyltransferase [Streptomyces sp. FH025]
MPELVDPNTRLRASFLKAVAEFHAEGPGRPVPWFVTDVDPPALTDAEAFAAYVARVLAERTEAAARPDARVPMTTLWWTEGDRVLGRLAIRHRLTPGLRRVGGHIGYDVRPSARRRGHATAMLAAALPVAAGLGIDRALLTCDEANIASRRVIEANGGRLLAADGGKLRFLLPTGSAQQLM